MTLYFSTNHANKASFGKAIPHILLVSKKKKPLFCKEAEFMLMGSDLIIEICFHRRQRTRLIFPFSPEDLALFSNIP